MKFSSLFNTLVCATLVFCLQNATAEKVTLIDEQFEEPSGKAVFFPPSTGAEFAYVMKSGSSLVSGWSVDGQVSVLYGEKLGTNESGGLMCKLEVAGGVYAQLTVESIPFPEVDSPAAITPEMVSKLRISFAAKIPEGEELEVAMGVVIPRDSTDDAFANRLFFPPIKGTGKYETYTFTAEDLPPAQLEGFGNLLKNVLTAGADKAMFNLALNLGKTWPQGESFQLDDVLVTFEK